MKIVTRVTQLLFIHHPSYFILPLLERATRFELATLSLEG